MAWNGSGTYSRTNGTNSGSTTWAEDASDGTKITASNHDTHDEDIATAINACLTKNNETKPTADFLPSADDSYDLGSPTSKWTRLMVAKEVCMYEISNHSLGELAGRGYIWVRDDTPNTLIFSDDAGTDWTLSGGQVKFPATQNASADANTLDDYEEGTWTPVLSDGTNNATSSTANGSYTKIGNVVFINMILTTTSMGSVSGDLRITGLPFTAASGNGYSASLAVGGALGLAITAGEAISAYVENNSAYILLEVWDSSAGTTSMQEAEWNTQGTLLLSGSYMV